MFNKNLIILVKDLAKSWNLLRFSPKFKQKKTFLRFPGLSLLVIVSSSSQKGTHDTGDQGGNHHEVRLRIFVIGTNETRDAQEHHHAVLLQTLKKKERYAMKRW